MLETDNSSRFLEKELLVKPNADNYTNICTGIGLDKEVPIRVAAYSLPVFQLGENVYGAQTEFYLASKSAIELNGLDTQVAYRNEQAIIDFIGLLQQKLKIDKKPVWLDEADPFELERAQLLTGWAEILREHGSERIVRFAESRDGDESLKYIAAHSLYMWDTLDIDPSLFITQRSEAPKSLMMIGGPAEKIFYESRQVILDYVPNSNRRVTEQQFSEIGRRPPYYKIDGEESIRFGNIDSQRIIDLDLVLKIQDPDVLRDTLYLLIGLSETLDFSDIKRIKKGAITDHERQDLTESCKSLEEMVRQIES